MQILKKHRLQKRFNFSKSKFKKALVTFAPKNSLELLQIKNRIFNLKK